MSLQLYQVDTRNCLLDFKSLNTMDHPDARRVEHMTRASMRNSMSESEKPPVGKSTERYGMGGGGGQYYSCANACPHSQNSVKKY